MKHNSKPGDVRQVGRSGAQASCLHSSPRKRTLESIDNTQARSLRPRMQAGSLRSIPYARILKRHLQSKVSLRDSGATNSGSLRSIRKRDDRIFTGGFS
jgi:hypothetical protein